MLWNLVGLDQLCYERHLSPNRVKFLSEERGGCYGVTRLPVGTCRGGRQRGGTLLIIWRIVASAGFCGHLLSYTRSLCQEIVKADKYSLFCKWWLRRIKGPAYSSLERRAHLSPCCLREIVLHLHLWQQETLSERKSGLKHSGRLESYSNRNANHFSALAQQSPLTTKLDLTFPVAFYSASFHARLFHYHHLKSKKPRSIFSNLIYYSIDVPILGNTV